MRRHYFRQSCDFHQADQLQTKGFHRPEQLLPQPVQLPERMQSEVAYRIATMENITPNVLQQIEESLEASLRDMLTGNQDVGGPKVVADIRINYGLSLGEVDGDFDGLTDGDTVGLADGDDDGLVDGDAVGLELGLIEAVIEGLGNERVNIGKGQQVIADIARSAHIKIITQPAGAATIISGHDCGELSPVRRQDQGSALRTDSTATGRDDGANGGHARAPYRNWPSV